MAVIKLRERGTDLIKSYETLKLKAYMPTPNDVPTIGWGHTKGVRMGQTITEQKAQELFLEDVNDSVEAVAMLAKKMAPRRLTESMIDALISLVFNAGSGAISSSNSVGKALISGDYYAAWAAFPLWRKQRNRTTKQLENVLGLARRRSREMVLFLEDGIPK